jgi:hypothetical protein
MVNYRILSNIGIYFNNNKNNFSEILSPMSENVIQVSLNETRGIMNLFHFEGPLIKCVSGVDPHFLVV